MELFDAEGEIVSMHRRWQIKKRINSRERWLDMDDWFHERTEIFFGQYQRNCCEHMKKQAQNARPRGLEPCKHIFEELSSAAITYRWDFKGVGAPKYTLTNVKSGEESDIRLISYHVLEPRFTEESHRFQ